jgi:tetratricopeptide (TPR) repeat protein
LLQNPADAAALNLKGLALREQKKDQEAAQAFRQAVQSDPKHAGAYYNLGALCASRLKDMACARQAFQAFLELEPASERAIRIRVWLTRQGF